MKRKFCLTPNPSQSGLDIPSVPKVTERFRDIHLDRDNCAHSYHNDSVAITMDTQEAKPDQCAMATDMPGNISIYRNPGNTHSSSSMDSKDGLSPDHHGHRDNKGGSSPGYHGFPDDVFDTELEFSYDSETRGFPSFNHEDGDTLSKMRGTALSATHQSRHRKLPTVFRWEGGGKQVYLSGSFDNWKSKIPMVKSHNDFFTIVELAEGDHQFKYYVDNQWVCDQHQTQIDNDMGSKNNQMTVNCSDFEVFEALATDSNAEAKDGGPASPNGEYSQHIPPRSSSGGFHHGGPPVLPPHLLQVILNKEIPLHNEPNLLPEPNHVMLNHLYALSIKDGVMVLSATHRYRKKYVTTLLYKPIQ